jgi:hypothetical protein
LASGVRTRPRLSCLKISRADNNDAVDVIASRLRHLHYLRQVVLRATLTRFLHGVHHQKGGVDAVGVVVFAYYICTNPQKQRGAVRNVCFSGCRGGLAA